MEEKGTHQTKLSDFSSGSSISKGESRDEPRPSLFDRTRRKKDVGEIETGDKVRVVGMDKIGKVKAEGMGEFLIGSEKGVKWEVWKPDNLLEKIETG